MRVISSSTAGNGRAMLRMRASDTPANPPVTASHSSPSQKTQAQEAQAQMPIFGAARNAQYTSIIRAPAYPWLLNEAGYVRAGHVLKLIDIAGSEPALRHLNQPGGRDAGGLVVTASLDRTSFHQPIRLWEMIRLEGRVTQVWRSSLETQVRVKAENIITGESRDIANAYLVFVGLDAKTRQKKSFPPYRPETSAARRLALAADIRKKYRAEEGKVAPFIPINDAEDDPVVLRQVMTPNESNAQSNVFGGIILSILEDVASQTAKKQALGQTVVGVSQDRMSFIAPTFIGETVEARAIITKTWHTSMEIQVEVDAVNPTTSERRKVASSYLVYVRLGANGKPGEVPPFTPRTELQKQRAESADRRRELREREEATTPPPHWEDDAPTFWDRIKRLFA